MRQKTSSRAMGRLRMTIACGEVDDELPAAEEEDDGGERNAPGFQRRTAELLEADMRVAKGDEERRARRMGGRGEGGLLRARAGWPQASGGRSKSASRQLGQKDGSETHRRCRGRAGREGSAWSWPGGVGVEVHGGTSTPARTRLTAAAASLAAGKYSCEAEAHRRPPLAQRPLREQESEGASTTQCLRFRF